jgi:adenylate kinase
MNQRSGILVTMQVCTIVCCTLLATAAHAAGPLVVMVGPPGSGRTTQTQILLKDLKMAVIAADDLIQKNPQRFQKNRLPALQGVEMHLDPAMNSLVEEALKTTDLSRGVVLDGYPASKTQGDFLKELQQKFGLPRAIVIHLSAPDDVVRKRLAGNKSGRDLEQELKDYHREFDFMRTYFPEADIRTVDATKPIAQVSKEIQSILKSKN